MRVSKGSHCSAINCSNNRGRNSDLSFFRFPKEPERSKRWVINCHREDLLHKDVDYLSRNCCLCPKHFDNSQFMNCNKNSLIKTAVPTLFEINNPAKAVTLKRKARQHCDEMQQSKRTKLTVCNFHLQCTHYKCIGAAQDRNITDDTRTLPTFLSAVEGHLKRGVCKMEQTVCPVFEPVWVQEIKIEPADLPDLKEEDPTAGYGDSLPNGALGDKSEEACEDFQVKSEEHVKTEIEVEEHSIPEEDSSLLTSDSSDIRDQQDELESDQWTPVETENTICKMFTEKPFKLPFNMESIDTELVIDEIRKRPALWDPSSDDYKNRQQKKDGWIEVCGIFIPNYTERSDEEKVQIGKDIQLKWRHIRDAYVRYIRLTKRGKSRNGAKPVKTYVYAKHLDFLKVTVSPDSTETSLQMQVLGDAIEVNDATIDDVSPNIAGREFQCPGRSASTLLKKRKRNLEEKLMSYIDMQQEEIKRGKRGEDNDDMTFFKSLMPTLQKLRPEEKLAFRVDVMKLLITYCESIPQNVPQHSQTYNIPYQQPACGSNFPVTRPQPSPHMMLSIQPPYPQVENSQTLPIHHLSIEPPHAKTSMFLPSATEVTSMQIQRQAASPETSFSPDSNTSFVSDSSESLLSCI